MDKKNVKNNINNIIEQSREQIIEFGEHIYANPETGFKEYNTSKYVAESFRKLGLVCSELGDIPGVKATLDTGKEGPGIAVLGELDSVVCTGHPHSNRETGAVHACGHNVQLACMLGAAIGLLKSDVLADLCGKIHFIAVPAEEFIEAAYRMKLREEGRIKYLSGKQEFLYRGLLDDVDICMMMHAMPGSKKFYIESSTNGFIVKNIRYIGKAAHAGGEPEKGVNALYAAELGMMAINSIRETFREQDYIRVHPIITKGGEAVNVIPSDVRLETLLRGKTMDAVLEASKKVNRALLGGAVALGAEVEIEDIPGFFPMSSDRNLAAVHSAVMKELVNESDIDILEHSTISTDMGDLSAIMPTMHPYIGGCTGALHGADFKISDPETAYIISSKLLANTAVELLWDNAGIARNVIKNYKPLFNSEQDYFNFIDNLFSKRTLPGKELDEILNIV